MSKTILIVDDEKSILLSLEGILADEGFEVQCESSGGAALERIKESIPDLVLLDIWMPGMDGMETLVKIKEAYPTLQVIMMSGHGTIETAVKATKLGAYDFIEKPLSLEKILLAVNNALQYFQLEEEITLFREKEKSRHTITGESRLISDLKEQIKIVAPTDAWVLITGENGTGKELVAHAIHGISRRSRKPMIEVNCAAIPEELIESELFGHEKGAFTGAGSMKKGKIDLANEGTLFLDEIGDMSLKAQSKTLRILQEQKFERVGGSKTIHVDVRVIAATNKNLENEIEQGRFRDDLYYRLNVVPINVPSLRERIEDIPDLVDSFLTDIHVRAGLEEKSISDEALDALKKYHWPGNVRELKNLVERLVIMSRGNTINVQDIPFSFNQENRLKEDNGSFMNADSLKDARAQFEKAFIIKKLQEFNGNISHTAEAIGIERSNLHKKIKAYGLLDFKVH
jgi:two-component system nitrogen regulation response regulator NtrX